MKNSIKQIIKPGALSELESVVRELYGTLPRAVLVCDDNTYKAAGEKIEREYKGPLILIVLGTEGEKLKPEEPSIGEILLKIPENTELFFACGSGVVNDITRFVSYKLQKPFISIATACSMDGYASTISPLVLNKLKNSFPAVPARAIIADTDILVKAPAPMASAGFGDILGKVIAKTDWILSNTVNNEPINEKAMEMVENAVSECIDLVLKVKKTSNGLKADLNTAEIAEALMRALITAGLSMAIAGNSRPAAGSEHLISHFLGMKALFDLAPTHLHGRKVAFGTFLMAKLYYKVFSLNFSEFSILIRKETAVSDAEYEKIWKDYLLKAYGPLGEGRCIRWKKLRPDKDRISILINTLENKWTFLQKLVKDTIPPIKELEDIYKSTGLSLTREEMGYSSETVREAMLCSKDFGNFQKYSLLHLLDELKILEIFI
jgi:glycerol-1-phosphate dehydrogenase [NAD(P)+]